ncbi:VanZ family protein [Pseudoclavibacter sp. CFCC 14310]|uniref:VanZ family protein n=1 Tax=Pseudoclavibacter sp. CFCC 14310 TaxID=2615180 RepID=UPI0013014B7E|nr:VanZ family protein [Pseudoclavibacter sp. CFCC 14310]KAB1647335.1 VanZ family protein [Pseudoclavibacter sp. CFCC 14310]
MSSVLQPGLAVLAVVLGTLVAFVLFVPFVIVSYRRRGSADGWWVGGWLITAVYLAALVCYTLLPLPSSGQYVCRGVQLSLGHDLRHLLASGPSVGGLMRSMVVWQLALNVALFVPLGVLLRVRHSAGVVVAAIGGLGVSLLIELTQLTGVWGLYPCAYRVFDVDDLTTNTLGAIIGSLAAIPFISRGTQSDRTAPTPVTALRRLTGMLCDATLVFLAPQGLSLMFFMVVAGLWPGSGRAETLAADPRVTWLIWCVPLAVQLVFVLWRGRTFGEWAVLLRSRPADARPAWLERGLRFLAGSGGFGLLAMLDAASVSGTISGAAGESADGWRAWLLPAAWVFAIASLIGVWATRDRRGLAAAVAGLRIEDQRASAASAHASRPAGDASASREHTEETR